MTVSIRFIDSPPYRAQSRHSFASRPKVADHRDAPPHRHCGVSIGLQPRSGGRRRCPPTSRTHGVTRQPSGGPRVRARRPT
jgi:hypothetical protein